MTEMKPAVFNLGDGKVAIPFEKILDVLAARGGVVMIDGEIWTRTSTNSKAVNLLAKKEPTKRQMERNALYEKLQSIRAEKRLKWSAITGSPKISGSRQSSPTKLKQWIEVAQSLPTD